MMLTRHGEECCGAKLANFMCVRAKNHHGEHASVIWEAEERDAFERGAQAMKRIVSHYLDTKGWFMSHAANASIRSLGLPDYEKSLTSKK